MNESCRKISRGQVWFLVDNDVPLVHTQGSVQGKNRPWLVVSNNACNQSSPIYTVVPLTTQTKKPLPTHVEFELDGKTQTILCEQIRTISQQAFFNAGSHYKWSMSEKYMNMVDEALAIQLGLSLIFPKSDQFWETLAKLIRVRVKQAIADTKVEAVDISKIATLLDAKVEEAVKEETTPVPEPVKEEPAPEIVEEKSEEPPMEKKADWVPVKKSKRRHWSDEDKKKFIEYVNAYGCKSAAAFYELGLNSVYVTKMKFMKELGLK